MIATILVVNAGSSSIKFSLFAHNSGLDLLYRGAVSGIGNNPVFKLDGEEQQNLPPQADHVAAFEVLLDWLQGKDLELIAVGHRMVHGGNKFTQSQLVTPELLLELEQLIPLAPLHQPHNLAPIRILAQLRAKLPQIVCFDTAFHTTQPNVATSFAIPQHYAAQGIKRYGFHGLSYEYIAQMLPQLLGSMPKRCIVCHLGNGASLAALKQGVSIATTMGFTALDGVPMGSRPGDLDAGVVLHWFKQGLDADKVEQILYHECGLLGLSGISNDMQVLLKSEAAAAKFAIEVFNYQISTKIGSLTAALGGLDCLVFTAGIGEHAHSIRFDICKLSSWLGIELQPEQNINNTARCISTPQSKISVWVIPTFEEKMIAQHTLKICSL
jgi:acetate kinase